MKNSHITESHNLVHLFTNLFKHHDTFAEEKDEATAFLSQHLMELHEHETPESRVPFRNFDNYLH